MTTTITGGLPLTNGQQTGLGEAVREYGAAKFAAGMACGTGASPDWDRADQAYAAVLDLIYGTRQAVPA